MIFEDLLKIDKYLSLISLYEYEENSLRVIVSLQKTTESQKVLKIGDNELKNIKDIVDDEKEMLIQIDFPRYILYMVENESYSYLDKKEIFIGRMFRIYSKSRFLDFINLKEDYINNLIVKHYSVPCLNHSIDIVTSLTPIVSRIKRA